MDNLYSHAIKFAFPVASLVLRKLIGEEKQDNRKSFIFFQCNTKVISVFEKQKLMSFWGLIFHCKVTRINFAMKSLASKIQDLLLLKDIKDLYFSLQSWLCYFSSQSHNKTLNHTWDKHELIIGFVISRSSHWRWSVKIPVLESLFNKAARLYLFA